MSENCRAVSFRTKTIRQGADKGKPNQDGINRESGQAIIHQLCVTRPDLDAPRGLARYLKCEVIVAPILPVPCCTLGHRPKYDRPSGGKHSAAPSRPVSPGLGKPTFGLDLTPNGGGPIWHGQCRKAQRVPYLSDPKVGRHA